MTDDPERLPWERQKAEPSKAFAAFVHYRDMGPTRSLRRIGRSASRAPSDQDAREHLDLAPIQTVTNWSRSWAWVTRCEAWDRHLDDVTRTEIEAKRREMVQQHDAIATQLLNKVAQRIVGDELNQVPALDVGKLTPSELIRIFVESAKIQRLSRGEPTEISQVQGRDGGPVRISVEPKDDEEALARYQTLEDVGDVEPGTTATIRAALVAMGQLPDCPAS